MDRKTARRFAQAATADHAVARAVFRPTVLDRYQTHLHRRWREGCRDAAVLHAEITALGYRGSLRTVYRHLQPLRAGAVTPTTDTNGLGHCRTWTHAWSASSEASDSAGHFAEFCKQVLSPVPASHPAAGIMPGGRVRHRYWWDSPG